MEGQGSFPDRRVHYFFSILVDYRWHEASRVVEQLEAVLSCSLLIDGCRDIARCNNNYMNEHNAH